MLMLLWLTFLVSSLIMTIRFWSELPKNRRTGLLLTNSFYLTFLTNEVLDMLRGRSWAPLNLGSVPVVNAVILLFPAALFTTSVVSYVRNFRSYQTWKELGWRTLLAVIHMECVAAIGIVCYLSLFG